MNHPWSRKAFLGTLGSGTLGASLSRPASAQSTYTMRLSVTTAPASLFGLAAVQFATAVNQRTKGQLRIEVYPSGQIANERESIDGLVSGVLDLSIQASAWLETFLPRYQIFDMPFLFKDTAAGYRVLDGPIGTDLFAELESKGIVGLTWGTAGFKQLDTTSKAIVVPDDMKGLRMRVQSGAIWVALYQALGAIPVTIDASETMVALQQRTVDGLDFNLDALTTGKFYTVVKHVAMSNHTFSVDPLLGSKRKIEALPAPLQRVLKDEGKALTGYWRTLYEKQIGTAIQTLKSNGVAFTDIQYPAFRKAMDPVYASYTSKIGADLFDRVSRALNSG